MDHTIQHKNRNSFACEEICRTGIDDTRPYCSFLHVQGPQSERISAHYHEYIEIIYVLEGIFEASVSSYDFRISSGDLLLVNSREPHAFRWDPHCKYICFQFDPFILFPTSRASFEARYIMPFIMSCTSPQRVITSSELAGTNIPFLLEDADREYTAGEYGFDLSVRADICRIFLWFLRKWHAQGVSMMLAASVRDEDIKRIESVLSFIDGNYMYMVSAEKMAALCNMSYSYFSRFFKAVIGKTFSEYLTYIRVAEAERLLVRSGMSISQIAAETGFSNTSYFIMQFKKHLHMTPKKFKQHLMIESGS